MEKTALIMVLNNHTNPLKGYISYYNFFLNGEISKLIFKKFLNLEEKEKIVLFKNNICKMFPEKILFFINFSEDLLTESIEKTMLKLNIKKYFIVRG